MSEVRTTYVKAHPRKLPEKKPDPLQSEIDRRMSEGMRRILKEQRDRTPKAWWHRDRWPSWIWRW